MQRLLFHSGVKYQVGDLIIALLPSEARACVGSAAGTCCGGDDGGSGVAAATATALPAAWCHLAVCCPLRQGWRDRTVSCGGDIMACMAKFTGRLLLVPSATTKSCSSCVSVSGFGAAGDSGGVVARVVVVASCSPPDWPWWQSTQRQHLRHARSKLAPYLTPLFPPSAQRWKQVGCLRC